MFESFGWINGKCIVKGATLTGLDEIREAISKKQTRHINQIKKTLFDENNFSKYL